MEELGCSCIFSPCRKNVSDILTTPLGSQAVETREVMYPKMQNQQKDDVSHTNCRSKRNRMILCSARRAWWSWAEISSILSSLSCWRCSKSCDEIAPNSRSHPRSEGWRENQLSYSREKFSSTHLYTLLAIILMDESSYISCFTWYLWKNFVVAWKCKNNELQVQPRREWRLQPIINKA